MDSREFSLQKLLQLECDSFHGTDEFVSLCRTHLKELPFAVQVQSVDHSFDGISKRQKNLVISLGDTLVDTVKPTGLFFVNRIDKKYGRVTFWSQFQSLKLMVGKNLSRPIYIAAVCGSEFSHFGFQYLMRTPEFNPAFLVAASQTNCQWVHRADGCCIYRVILPLKKKERDLKNHHGLIKVSFSAKTANVFSLLEDLMVECKKNHIQAKVLTLKGGHGINELCQELLVEFAVPIDQYEEFLKLPQGEKEFIRGNHVFQGYVPENFVEKVKIHSKDFSITFVQSYPEYLELYLTCFFEKIEQEPKRLDGIQRSLLELSGGLQISRFKKFSQFQDSWDREGSSDDLVQNLTELHLMRRGDSSRSMALFGPKEEDLDHSLSETVKKLERSYGKMMSELCL